ncbi:MAG: gamma-glutamyltransferase [Gammaproteobacteria bacterium]|nr:gamma-glutamyltransferase [Gammaproteobacteria bacterium]
MFRVHALLICLLLAFNLSAASLPPRAAIATAHPIATEAGLEILAAGGNAFDAAVAVSATLAVVEPYSSGIGGGGFWLLHRAADGKQVMIDGREKAPLAASRTMYQDDKGNVVPGLSVDGALAAGIPGEPAALVRIAESYGQLPLSRSLAPAIRAARNGFKVTPHYRRMAQFRLKALQASPAAAKVFLLRNEVPPLGHLIVQADLANTLQALAEQGRAGFYQGKVAKRLLAGMKAAGGIWSAQDFSQYEVVERSPIVGSYRGYRIISAPPPSSGGVALVAMFNILEKYRLKHLTTLQRQQVIVEAMRRAYRDRAEHLGDSDFVDVPVKQLTDKTYAATLQRSISLKQATPSKNLGQVADTSGGNHTTHFSILDNAGNRVAATLSINYPFGSGFMPPGTGVLLNDEMDDFSAKPGVPNVYGLVGAEANAIAPGKRMLSSMSPTFIESKRGTAILGTPGGSRIITMVLLASLGYTEGLSADAMVSLPRYHHQYLPDMIFYEADAISDQRRVHLQAMGHELKALQQPYGNMQVVIWDKQANTVSAASDPRGEGKALLQ